MPIYVVLSPPEQVGESLEEQVKAGYTENDRHEIMPGAWFIRSPLITTDQVRENLDIKVGGNSGDRRCRGALHRRRRPGAGRETPGLGGGDGVTAPIPFPGRRRRVAGGNGGGPSDERIHAIELDVLEIRTRMENVATTNDIDKLKARMENVATTNDIDRLKLWAAGGALAGTLAIIGWLVVWISRLLATASAPPIG